VDTDEPITLGPFELLAPIGRGGMGIVWHGRHRGQGVPVAVKVLTAERAREPSFRAAFRNEVRAVAGLDHPGIVLILDHGEVPAAAAARGGAQLLAGSPYLAMELASEGSLARLLEPGQPALPWPQVRALLLALLDCLAHAHARAVIHRDLKPENILLCGPNDPRPGLKLTDFGVAAQLDHEQPAVDQGDQLVGSPHYMAPEQFQGLWRDYGPWTDLYALGCVAHELTTGRRPVSGTTLRQVATGHLFGRRRSFEPRLPVPDEFEDWLERLLTLDPRLRFQRAADAACVLERMADPPGCGVEAVSALPIDTGAEAPTRIETGPLEAWLRETRWESVCLTKTRKLDELASTIAASRSAGNGAQDGASPPDGQAAVVPQLPSDWRREWTDVRSMQLVGAGLGLYGLRTLPLVDREEQRDALWGALGQVRTTGRALAVLLKGPAGCGKTRLAQWLCERAHEVGSANVLRAYHTAIPGPAMGLAPMVSRYLRCEGLSRSRIESRLEGLLRGQGVTDPGEWQALTELLRPRAVAERAATSPGVQLTKATERQVLVLRLLERLAAERPVLVLLDDVQYGADSLAFARRVLERHHPSPILLLLTARDEELAEREAEAELVEELLRDPGTATLEIGPLEPEHRAALVRELLGLQGELAARVEERTAGNPLFAVELVGDWVRRGLLVPGEGGFQLQAGAEVDLPDDLHEVWARRVERVLAGRPADDSRALELAAALGQEVDEDEWAACCRQLRVTPSPDLVDALLGEWLARRVEGGEAGDWTFVHGMLRESIGRRAREAGRWPDCHRACAEVLRLRRGPGVAERLGRHYLEAGLLEAALPALASGTQELLDLGEYRRAEVLLAERSQCMDRLDLPGSHPHRVELCIQTSMLHRSHGRYDDALRWARQAEEGAGAAGRVEQECHAVRECGRALANLGDREGAWEAIERASTLAQHSGNQRLIGACRWNLGDILLRQGQLEQAQERFTEALADYEACGSVVGQSRCLIGLGDAARQGGRLDDAQRYYEDALRSTRQGGIRWGVAGCLNVLGEVARYRGRYDEAEDYYRRAREAYEAIGSSVAIYPATNRALVLVTMQRHAEARPLLEEILGIFESQGVKPMIGAVNVCLLPCVAAAGDWTAWDRHLERARSLLAETSFNDADTAAMATLAGDEAEEHGDPERARAAYELALEQYRHLAREAEVEAVLAKLEALPR
jgi:tetratricopeptide (TPR) repeat protein